jgi:hypothetical protein
MIDLETLGTHPATAPIIQIGAVAFQLTGDGPDPRVPMFRMFVEAKSCLGEPFNRRIDPSTVAWWAESDPALLVEIMKGKGIALGMALIGLNEWFASIGEAPEGVWANGPTFDVIMLEAAYDQARLPTPWSYRAIRDVRTMAMIAGDDNLSWEGGTKTPIEEAGQKHDALVDCLRQLRMVQQTWKRRIRK